MSDDITDERHLEVPVGWEKTLSLISVHLFYVQYLRLQEIKVPRN